MKRGLSFILLGMFFLFFAATASAQGNKVSLTLKRESLPKALYQVERQSGYYKINYDYGQLERYSVSAVISDKTALEAVNILLRDVPYEAQVDGKYIHVKASANKKMPTRQMAVADGISGRVVDKDGEPLIGATVLVPGTQKKTVTDADGRFSLPTATVADNLEISYIGKKTVRLKAGRRNLSVIAGDDDNFLSDVLVTGYQQLSRERATGSFDKVSGEELANRPTSDLSSSLQGLVAGMQDSENQDGSVSFKIRGTSSLYADTAPLVVVDGFPIDGAFTTINPNDVESVTILKDASAASIWGARSANGVIVVTTKRARQDSRVSVSSQAFWRIAKTQDLDYILAQADSKTAVDYELKALSSGWQFSTYQPGGVQGLTSGLTETQELYYDNLYGNISEAEMNAGLDKLRNRSNRDQLKKYLMQQQLLQQYNVSISGGTRKFDHYLSLMYEKNDEATIKRGYEKFMANWNATYRFNRNISATAAFFWQKKNQDNSGFTLSQLGNLQPYEMLLNDDGSYAYNSAGFNRQEVSKIDASSFPYSDFSYNMLQEVRTRSYKTKNDNIRIQLGLNAKIIEGLTYDIKYQYERNRYDYKNIDGEDTYSTRYDVNYYTTFDGQKCTKSFLPTGAKINSGKSEAYNWVLRNQLSYNTVLADKHDISALAGIEMSEYVTSITSNPRLYGYNEKTNTSPAPYYGSKSSIGNIMNYGYDPSSILGMAYSFSDRTDRYLSYFANAAYMYDNKYGVSASIRSDGSNFVSEDKSLRWSPMWSVGAKWNVTKEEFMRNADFVDRLTLRATYGLNGNAEKSTSPQTLISLYSSSATLTDVASIASAGNPTLRWETTKTFNLGLDFSLFKNILSGKVDFYNRKSQDVIGTVTIPSTYGSSTQKFNTAEILNRGVELELTGKYTIQNIGLGIRSTLTFAYNKNKVTKLYNPNITCQGYMYAANAANGYFIEGKPIGAIYAYEYAGMENGQPYVYGPDGTKNPFNDMTLQITKGSDEFLTYKGSSIAPYTLGWSNEFTWNGLSLYFYLTGKFGAYFRAPVAENPPLIGVGNTFISKYISYYAESDGSKYPTFPEAGDYMCFMWNRYMPYLSCFVENASFIRLKEVTLSYQLPRKLLSKVHLNQVKAFCQVRDLGLIWSANSLGYDPEWLPGAGYKPAVNVTFGLNINF